MYSIHCKCGQVYIGHTGSSTETIVMEHHQHIFLELPDKLAVAKYNISLGHCIQLQNTSILLTKSRYTGRQLRLMGI
jgi:hypothetical protein